MPLRRAAAPSAIDIAPAAAALLEALHAGDVAARRLAARELGLACAMPVEDRLDALGRRLAVEPAPEVREALLMTLVEIGGARAAEVVAPLLAHADPALRNSALAALRLLNPDAAAVVDRLRASPVALDRLLAAEILCTWPAAEVLPRLHGWLQDEGDANVCGVLLELAARAGDARLLPVLTRFADDDFLGFGAAEAARAIRSRGA